jgi:hypothetical protein
VTESKRITYLFSRKDFAMPDTPASSRSPVDTFAHYVEFDGTKPGAKEAVYTALAGVDVDRLGAFMKTLHDLSKVQFSHSNFKDYIDQAVPDALRSTNGADTKANIDFARKIQAAFKAVDASPDVTPPGMSQSFSARVARMAHGALTGLSNTIDHYIDSELLPQPQAIPDAQRRHFNKAELTRMEQHVVAGTASRSEIMDVQKELKDSGLDLGKFGQNHDGIDGKAGKFTLGAVAKAMKLAPPSP